MTDETTAPAWVDDEAVPLSDEERLHYEALIDDDKAGDLDGAQRLTLARRAMKGMDGLQELLVSYSVITEQGSYIAIQAMEQGAGVEGVPGEVKEAIGDAAMQSKRALLALMAHARMTIALAVIVDRHSLAWDERDLVSRAMELQPPADYERYIADEAISTFIEELSDRELTLADEHDLTEWNDPRTAAAREAAVEKVAKNAEDSLDLVVSAERREANAAAADAAEDGALTYWNGEACLARRVTLVVGPDEFPESWAKSFEGQRRDAVEVVYNGTTFYLDDDEYERTDEMMRHYESLKMEADRRVPAGGGWRKVTEGRGSPVWGHRDLTPVEGTVEARS